MNKISSKRMVVVDLYAGSYNKANIGHELFNLSRNPVDNYFYGYCPPWDGIVITKFGAKNNEQFTNDVLVVYVTKKEKSNNREIIAFCINARVYKTAQSEVRLNRIFTDKNGEKKEATYSIQSDNLYNLENRFNKFEIKLKDYNDYMFRKQRFYGGTYPNLDDKIIAYLEAILENNEILDNDDNEKQEEIQNAEPASLEDIQDSADKPLCVVNGSKGKVIAKDSRISKSALVAAKYTCIIDSSHKTFLTKKGIQYMEGHHLIPCTVKNSKEYNKKFKKNIDCFENIVCICPNCHREVHYGEWKSKSEKIKIMFKKQGKKLRSVKILITENELLNLYKRG